MRSGERSAPDPVTSAGDYADIVAAYLRWWPGWTRRPSLGSPTTIDRHCLLRGPRRAMQCRCRLSGRQVRRWFEARRSPPRRGHRCRPRRPSQDDRQPRREQRAEDHPMDLPDGYEYDVERPTPRDRPVCARTPPAARGGKRLPLRPTASWSRSSDGRPGASKVRRRADRLRRRQLKGSPRLRR